MDRRVLQAMQLLQEAGRLDLLAANAARRARPARQAASGVAAAIAACSPPEGGEDVRRCRAPYLAFQLAGLHTSRGARAQVCFSCSDLKGA
ncbi:hypothetical protein NDU88_003553 [Pleurodeles waltl]|uniref:Uncharacterized protein n=1 Tax=Pleurodeles waltl TaxID=8319 RepID=A0AAV7T5M6_PLEWA|nr:hypothetical protein NDU88_003553 [Pleurodeles waltl]